MRIPELRRLLTTKAFLSHHRIITHHNDLMCTVLPFRWAVHQVKIELTGRVREFGEHNLNRVVDTMDIDCPHSIEKPDPEEAADAPQKNAATSGRVPQSFLGQMVLSCALLLGLGWLGAVIEQ
jgi:hypothetical protein